MFFKKKAPKTNFKFRVLLNDHGKFSNLLSEATNLREVYLLYFFEETKDVVLSRAKQNWIDLSEEPDSQGIKLISTDRVSGIPEKSKVILCDYHPLLEENAQVIEQIQDQLVTTYASLEDPLMRLFGSERIAALMGKMDISEDEPLQNAMIDKSIQRAMEKVAKDVKQVTQNSVSQKDWIEKNGIL
jgi:hypothetical protein